MRRNEAYSSINRDHPFENLYHLITMVKLYFIMYKRILNSERKTETVMYLNYLLLTGKVLTTKDSLYFKSALSTYPQTLHLQPVTNNYAKGVISTSCSPMLFNFSEIYCLL